jgi:hypothetical protein
MSGEWPMPARSPWKGMFAFDANAAHPPDAASSRANVPFQGLRAGVACELENGVVHLFRRAAKQASDPWWLLKSGTLEIGDVHRLPNIGERPRLIQALSRSGSSRNR